MTTWRFDRDSTEMVGPIVVTDDGVAALSFQVALVARGTRPAEADWQTPTDVAGEKFLLVGPGDPPDIPAGLTLTSGTYILWALHADSPERHVIPNVATIYIT